MTGEITMKIGSSGETLMERVLASLLLLKASSGSFTVEQSKILSETLEVVQGLDPYLTESTTQHAPILDSMVSAVMKNDWNGLHKSGKTKYPLIPEMCAGGYEAQVICQLATISKAARILEIGVFASTTTVALALLPSVKKIVALDIEPYLVEFGTPFWKEAGVENKIEMIIGDGLESLDTLDKKQNGFDLIFIDADKDNYLNYYNKILSSSLLNEGGVIVVDNTLYKATVFAPGSWSSNPALQHSGLELKKFNSVLKNDDRVNVVLLPIRDGISLVTRRQ